MQRILLAGLLAVAVSACGASRASVEDAPRVPLQASIVAPLERSGFLLSINRPAHLALFEVIPGRGASLIYPWVADEVPFQTGSIFAHSGLLVPGRWVYAPTLPFDHSRPRFILMIASDEPLPLEPLRESPSGVRRALGHRTFTSSNPYKVMDRLAESLVPDQPDESWSVDVFVDWGPVMPPSIAYAVLTCGDGRALAVPRQYAAVGLGCPGDRVRWTPVANASVQSWASTRNDHRRRPPAPAGRIAEVDRPGGGNAGDNARTVDRTARNQPASRPEVSGGKFREGEAKKP